MKFNLYEQDKQTSVKKRVLKSTYKNLKYEANSFSADCKPKTQGSDYYIGVFDSKKD